MEWIRFWGVTSRLGRKQVTAAVACALRVYGRISHGVTDRITETRQNRITISGLIAATR
jgi:hypothetical protein